MKAAKKYAFIIFLVFVSFPDVVKCQQVPLVPISYRIFDPFVFNPAITGSKDFSSLDIIAGWQGKSNSQIISENSRLLKKGATYFTSPDFKEFTGIGLGGYLFNEENSKFRNTGIDIACSYHIPVDKESLSFISIGASFRGVSNITKAVTSIDPLLNKASVSSYYFNTDLGIYFYGPKFFAGVSVTNLLGNPKGNDSLSLILLPVSRQYFLITGYKILISTPLNIVIEPSLIVNAVQLSNMKARDILKPALKLYLQDFCLGTYFNNYSNISFFFQYRFPRFYIGSFFEIPKNTPYFQKELNFEFAVGINFSQTKSNYRKYYHW
jgi:type IX secretion system PorP/SprF family membrane protein